MKFLRRLASGAVAVAWLAGLPVVHAATLDITAQFRADSSKPHENKFVNTTPNSGYCTWYTAYCESAGLFSLMWASSIKGGPIQPNHENTRQGAMLKAPANWRTVQLTHTGTGHTETVKFRVAGIGAQLWLSPPAREIVGGDVDEKAALQMIFGSPWWQAPSPCTGNSSDRSGAFFFWRTPTEGVCAKRSQYPIPWFEFRYPSFAYELLTPNPIGMAGGRYEGSLTLSVGPGQDFDFGDVLIPTDPLLTLNFTLDVEHVLKVEVPPGGNRVELEPREGWQAWLNNGSRPTELFRDQMFHISASSPFTMTLECQYIIDQSCGIRAPGSDRTHAVWMYVTLPAGLTNIHGQAVNRRLLSLSSNINKFLSVAYVDRKPGTLHFYIAPSTVSGMLGRGPNSYTGTVTVIWNSEV